ncbi:hypothetical protein LR48_Vigan09g208600 [Vigna angularis]|uniref:Uncharacterized protein n=1 Tax=Phaseolus angularis TaxID=3914 RepID=A0A0L9VES0_PHAAN|nr:hypothetical protein LR48_Vigan09g208600 [Vigna angularis]
MKAGPTLVQGDEMDKHILKAIKITWSPLIHIINTDVWTSYNDWKVIEFECNFTSYLCTVLRARSKQRIEAANNPMHVCLNGIFATWKKGGFPPSMPYSTLVLLVLLQDLHDLANQRTRVEQNTAEMRMFAVKSQSNETLPARSLFAAPKETAPPLLSLALPPLFPLPVLPSFSQLLSATRF